ncbi:NUDIX domain-containing protein [Simiduia sp. 21SJ11W-1]|uniref:NUDIX domain-containing protein n=1 Tax=Simiduia sp. 21SJ11W-1 TaxID=2909669 RepID=UPI00209DA476|nr:NUDIX domain-containing protein [Simiduia sp. 21SJ11W-1]UTA48183.1 NUDIX domain-containing protein [Simiduia sp. 21SJ11W-1]
MIEPQFQLGDVEVAEKETTYQGFFRMARLKLRHKLFGGGWSGWMTRELFERGDAVAAILYDPQHDLVGFVEQFRVGALKQPYGPWCLEVVAGMTEPGETPEQVMAREIEEESGLQAARLIPICNYLSSPGGTDEQLHLFCAICSLQGAGGVFGLAAENEDIRLHVAPAGEVFANLYQGRFNNAATLLCLQWLQIHHAELRSGSSL